MAIAFDTNFSYLIHLPHSMFLSDLTIPVFRNCAGYGIAILQLFTRQISICIASRSGSQSTSRYGLRSGSVVHTVKIIRIAIRIAILIFLCRVNGVLENQKSPEGASGQLEVSHAFGARTCPPGLLNGIFEQHWICVTCGLLKIIYT